MLGKSFNLSEHQFPHLKRKGTQIIPTSQGFPGGSDGKESACNVGDLGSIPGSRRSPGGGNGNPLLPGESPWTEEPGGLQSMGYKG